MIGESLVRYKKDDYKKNVGKYKKTDTISGEYKKFDHGEDILENRNFKPLFFAFIVAILIFLIIYLLLPTFPDKNDIYKLKYTEDIKIEKKKPELPDYMINHYDINHENSCFKPYESVCENNVGVSHFEVGRRSNKLLIEKMNESIIKGIVENKKHDIFEHHNKNSHSELNKIQNETKSMNLFYIKCLDFFNQNSNEKINSIFNDELFKELLHSIYNFNKFSEIIGKLSKNNIQTPITIDLKPFVINKDTYITDEIFSVEMSGDPFLVQNEMDAEKTILMKYQIKKITEKILIKLGYGNSEKIYQNYLNINNFLLSCGLKKESMLNVDGKTEFMDYNELRMIFKNFDFDNYINLSGFHSIRNGKIVNVNNKNYFMKFDENYKKYDKLQWKHYFLLNLIYDFIKRIYNFNGKYENNSSKCVRIVKEYYPITSCRTFKHLLSKTEHLKNEEIATKKIEKIVSFLVNEYVEKITKNNFCLNTKESKNDIIKKIKNMKIYVGKCSVIDKINKRIYTTDNWINQIEKSEYQIEKKYMKKKDFVGIINAFHQLEIFKLERHETYDVYYKDSTESLTSLNAWFDNVFNIIVIPPGFLVYPFYSDKYVSHQLWSILTVVAGHEIYHAFEHFFQTNQYLNSQEIQCDRYIKEEFVKIYNCYRMGTYGDKGYGKRTLGENMADHYGLQISFDNWLKNIEDTNNLEEKKIRFFINYLRIWCKDTNYYYDDEDEHATSYNRAILPLLSLKEEFKTAFNCSFHLFDKKC